MSGRLFPMSPSNVGYRLSAFPSDGAGEHFFLSPQRSTDATESLQDPGLCQHMGMAGSRGLGQARKGGRGWGRQSQQKAFLSMLPLDTRLWPSVASPLSKPGASAPGQPWQEAGPGPRWNWSRGKALLPSLLEGGVWAPEGPAGLVTGGRSLLGLSPRETATGPQGIGHREMGHKVAGQPLPPACSLPTPGGALVSIQA